jgi:hypothetical protein
MEGWLKYHVSSKRAATLRVEGRNYVPSYTSRDKLEFEFDFPAAHAATSKPLFLLEGRLTIPYYADVSMFGGPGGTISLRVVIPIQRS